MNIKLVPHRGWGVGYFRALSTFSSSPFSNVYTTLCSAPWYSNNLFASFVYDMHIRYIKKIVILTMPATWLYWKASSGLTLIHCVVANGSQINKDIAKFSHIDRTNTQNKYKVSENFDWIKKKEQIDGNIKNNLFTLVDGRSRERFEGKQEEPRPGLKKGCIPGSKNIYFRDCINFQTNTFKTKSELMNIFKENNVDYDKPTVFTCGSGVTACVLGLAYFLISDKNAVIYDGSFAEWGKK